MFSTGLPCCPHVQSVLTSLFTRGLAVHWVSELKGEPKIKRLFLIPVQSENFIDLNVAESLKVFLTHYGFRFRAGRSWTCPPDKRGACRPTFHHSKSQNLSEMLDALEKSFPQWSQMSSHRPGSRLMGNNWTRERKQHVNQYFSGCFDVFSHIDERLSVLVEYHLCSFLIIIIYAHTGCWKMKFFRTVYTNAYVMRMSKKCKNQKLAS